MKITEDAIKFTMYEVMEFLHEHYYELWHEVTTAVWKYSRAVVLSMPYIPSCDEERSAVEVDVPLTSLSWDDTYYSHSICPKAECDDYGPIDFRYHSEETCLLKSGRERIWVDENGDLLPKQQAGNND